MEYHYIYIKVCDTACKWYPFYHLKGSNMWLPLTSIYLSRPRFYAWNEEIEQSYVGLYRMEQDKVAQFAKPLLFYLLYLYRKWYNN